MSQRASDDIMIQAPAETVMAIISDLESYPEWTEEITSVELLATDEQGRPQRAAFTVDASILQVHYTLEYSHAPNELSWTLLEADLLKRLDGSYVVEPRGERARVIYTLVGEVDVPLPASMKERAAQQILQQGLVGLKQRAESMGRR